MVEKMNKGVSKERATMAELAGGRARVYDLLVGVFSHLPDEQFLKGIECHELKHFLDICCDMKSTGFKSGVDCVQAYQTLMKSRPLVETLEELSVDRTGILRGTGFMDMKPPYEGLYKGKENSGDLLLEIKRVYRKAGLMPDDSVTESPDYLCIELDFMKHLCLREENQWASSAHVSETLAHEEAFLRNHLGSWVGDFCEQVNKHALTNFYRGFALILAAFIDMDMTFLKELDVHL